MMCSLSSYHLHTAQPKLVVGHHVLHACVVLQGWTALHAAASKGGLTIVEALLAKGANIAAKDSRVKDKPHIQMLALHA